MSTSQFFGLNIAYTGLLAANAALNTTSNNISNVQTDGYSRQQVVQQASDALRVFQTYGCAGAGVDTIAIERVRDEFYDNKYWINSTKQGEYGIKEYYMRQMEDYFMDDGISTGFKTIFNQFMTTGLQALMNNPSDADTKAQFIGYAGNLTEYFNGMSSSLEAIQKDVNQEIKLKVDEINSLASEIAALNKQINVIELNGGRANELRDRRTLLLDQLSAIVDIETKEIPITDPYNPDMLTGANRFLVTVAGGQLLLDTADYKQLQCVARPAYEKVNQTDIDGLYDIYWSDGQEFNIYNTQMGGALQGLIQMRDGNNGENFKGTVVSTGTVNTAQGVRDTVTIKVDADYLQDLNKSNLSDQGGEINLGNQLFYYDSWTYTCSFDANGQPTYTYTFQLSGNDKNESRLTTDRIGKAASIGPDLRYQGIPYYMNQMNEWVRNFAQKFNDILSSGYTSDGKKGTNLFTAKYLTGNEEYDLPDEFRYDHQTNGTLSVTDSSDSYYRLTAKNFVVVSVMTENGDLLATKKVQGDGSEQNDLLEELKLMANDKDRMSYRGSSAGEFLERILSDVALNSSNAQTFNTNYKKITTSVENQRISISGVDEDEEAVNLVKYQNAYTLSSKMIQTLTEVYDRLILYTGV